MRAQKKAGLFVSFLVGGGRDSILLRRLAWPSKISLTKQFRSLLFELCFIAFMKSFSLHLAVVVAVLYHVLHVTNYDYLCCTTAMLVADLCRRGGCQRIQACWRHRGSSDSGGCGTFITAL